MNSGINSKYSTVQIKRDIFYFKKKDVSFYDKIHLVYIFVKMWVGPLLAKPGGNDEYKQFCGIDKERIIKRGKH